MGQYLALKTELQILIGQMHRLSGADLSTEKRKNRIQADFKGVDDSGSDLLRLFSQKTEAARQGLQRLKMQAAKEQGLSTLLADRKTLKLQDIQGFLAPNEKVLLVFEHDGGNYLLLFGKFSDPEVHKMRGMDAVKKAYAKVDFHSENQGSWRTISRYQNDGSVDRDSDVAKSQFWEDQVEKMSTHFWKPISNLIEHDDTIILATSGAFHNISFEPGKPQQLGILTRIPGISFLALSRGFFGSFAPKGADYDDSMQATIIIDSSAKDIPLTIHEGRMAAKMWAGAETNVNVLNTWEAKRMSPKFLHFAGHGSIEGGLEGSQHAFFVCNGKKIGELELFNLNAPKEILINACIAGQTYENPLDGNPTGTISSFLRNGTKWAVASLVPLPDVWAFLAALIFTDLRSTSDRELPDLLDLARDRLVDGGWPDRVSEAFSGELGSVLSESRFDPHKKSDGEFGEQRASLLACIISDLRFATAGDHNNSRQRLEDRFSEEISMNWWLAHDPELIGKLLSAPENAQRTLEDAIREAVLYAQENGTPRIPEVDTVRYGWTLFGDPNPAGEKTDG